MKREYVFSKMESRRNPYASKLKRQVTIRMGDDVVGYFKDLAESRIRASSVFISGIAWRRQEAGFELEIIPRPRTDGVLSRSGLIPTGKHRYDLVRDPQNIVAA